MFWRRWRSREQELDRELRADLDLEAEEQLENGLTPEEASYAAKRAFGNMTNVTEDVRRMWGWMSLERFTQDMRYASRLLRKNPGFTSVAVFTLAIGIGANTAIFSITDAVLLRPLPYADANRLVRIWQMEPKMGEGHLGTAPPEFAAYRDRTRAFSALAGYQPASFDLTGDTKTEHIAGYAATASLFETLQIEPLLGRTFTKQEEAIGAQKVIVLSYEFWRRHYRDDPQIVGKLIELSERPYEVIGVMPRGFTFPATTATPGEPPSFWAPLSFTAQALNDWASSFDTSIIARVRPGVSLAQAKDDVRRVAVQFQREHRDVYAGTVVLDAMAEPWRPDYGAGTRGVIEMLCAAVGLLLLIACANIANLLLARAGARQREISIRRALGASAGRLTRQVLTETMLITFAGGALGCMLAFALLRFINTVSIKEINIEAAGIDFRVLSFTFVLSALTCLFCGIAPAWTFRRFGVNEGLKQSGRQTGMARSNRRAARALIVVEVGFCVLLLIGSGLLLRSFLRTLAVPLGFDPANTLLIRTTFNRHRYSAERRHAFERAIEARLASLPGVSDVALTSHVPLADERQIGFHIEGRPADEFHWADNALVSSEYFRVMKISLLRGRTFTGADSERSPLVAVINQSMAAQYWPKEDPIGKAFQWGGRRITVIGVVADIHVQALEKPVGPTIYNSVFQIESGASTSGVFALRVRDGQDALGLAASAQSSIWSIDKGLPLLGITTMEQVVSASLAIRRLSLGLVGSFAIIALVLALVGIYGVLSYAVAQRVQEMGLRLALGAKPKEITMLVVGEGMRLTLTGISLGVAVGAVTTRYISKLLFGVRSVDPLAFAAGSLLLFAVSFLASYLPAKRASRVDPMVALRYE